jgi:quercetin dioxygenase-like cupin family protein
MQVIEIDQLRRFDSKKMAKNNVFETRRFFLDLYCLEPGQTQAPHTHDGSDKVYVVLEGQGVFEIDGAHATLARGQALLASSGEEHGVQNPGPERLVCLVFMAPHPKTPLD